jgi:small subunit ribosomal protein S21
MKQRRSYEKPSERRNREKAEAIRRARKLARKKAQPEGLIADPRKKKLLDAKKALGQRPGTGDRFGTGDRPGTDRFGPRRTF